MADELYDVDLDELSPGEPFFILRGRDILASEIIRLWADRAEEHGCPADKVASARILADAMEAVPNRKYPD